MEYELVRLVSALRPPPDKATHHGRDDQSRNQDRSFHKSFALFRVVLHESRNLVI
jgi:hypothetical protein